MNEPRRYMLQRVFSPTYVTEPLVSPCKGHTTILWTAEELSNELNWEADLDLADPPTFRVTTIAECAHDNLTGSFMDGYYCVRCGIRVVDR